MTVRNPKVDSYFTAGCGRCPLVSTPECKVNDWREELKELREIILDCGLDEELKWSIPVYTFQKCNVVMISAFKEYCALSFFKGALLKDTAGILVQQTENVQAVRQIRFTDVRQIIKLKKTLKAYLREAVELEKAGAKVEYKKTSDFAIPEEFKNKLTGNSALQNAFTSLTPGRQRTYILHFSQPKQSKTREARIEKLLPQILSGKGMND